MAKRSKEEVNSLIAEYCDYVNDLIENESLNEGSLYLLTEASRPFTSSDLDALITSLESINNSIPREMKHSRKAISSAIDKVEDFYVNLTAGKSGYGKKEFGVLMSKIESLNDGLKGALGELDRYTRWLNLKKTNTVEEADDKTAKKQHQVVKGGNLHKKIPTPPSEDEKKEKFAEPSPDEWVDEKEPPAKDDKKHAMEPSNNLGPQTLLKDAFKDTRAFEVFRNVIKKSFTEKADDGVMAKIRDKLGMPSLTNWFGMTLDNLIEDIEMLPLGVAQNLFKKLVKTPDPVPDRLAKQTFRMSSSDTDVSDTNEKSKHTVDVFDLSAELDITPEMGRKLNAYLRKAGVKTVNYDKLKENFNEEDTVILEHWRRLAGMRNEDK